MTLSEGWMHDFHALCTEGHKRNFVWCSDTADKMNAVNDFCVICDKKREFVVKKYWQEPCLESKWTGVA